MPANARAIMSIFELDAKAQIKELTMKMPRSTMKVFWWRLAIFASKRMIYVPAYLRIEVCV